MKKLSILFYAWACMTSVSCRHIGNGNTDISYSDTHHYYSMEADFSKNRTRDVEEYMDESLGTTSNTSFVNTRIEGQLALNDHTTFYIKKYPGYIQIRLDKTKNSYESYQRIRSMCEGIKKRLTK
jgi:hypothetical protein